VFISYQSGEPISDSALLYMTRRVIEKAKLPEITLHGLRHTHCTILLNKGVNVKVISERLGNTPAMIYEVYGHVLKELEEETVQIFLFDTQTYSNSNHRLLFIKCSVVFLLFPYSVIPYSVYIPTQK
jgi:hypothetical protein